MTDTSQAPCRFFISSTFYIMLMYFLGLVIAATVATARDVSRAAGMFFFFFLILFIFKNIQLGPYNVSTPESYAGSE